MIRRIALAAVFAAAALSATGCCGTFRNLVYRIRHCHDCYPSYGGGVSYSGGPVVSPSYAAPIADVGPVIGGPAPGCASCSTNPVGPFTSASAGVPVVPNAGVPVVPAYSVQPGAAYPMAGGPVAGIK